MIGDYQVMEALKKVILEDVQQYIKGASQVEERGVSIGEPDWDNLPCNVNIYIMPDYGQSETQTFGDDRATLELVIFIMAHRGTAEGLTRQVFDVFGALETALRNNRTLNGTAEFISLPSWEFFPGVNETKALPTMRTTVHIEWTKY